MRIAICSDIHDNIWALERALPLMSEANLLLFCGDFCAPFSLTQLARGFEGPVHAVLGNNDGDQRLLLKSAEDAGNLELHGQFADLEIDKLRFAVNHYPDIARSISQGDQYDVVCYGHDHVLHEEKVGRALLVNPGEIMGRFGKRTFMLFDTSTRDISVIEFE